MSSLDLKNWKRHGMIMDGDEGTNWNAVVTNPSPLPLCTDHKGPSMHYGEACSSDILLVYRGCPKGCDAGLKGEMIGLAMADKFDGKYSRLNNDQPIFHNPAEDPFAWKDMRGNFHMLVHSLEPDGAFGGGPEVGRHAFSRSIDGPWTFNTKTLAFTTLVKYDDGTEVEFYRRERAQFLFSDDGKMTPLYMTTGVQEKNSSMSYTVIVPIGHAGKTF